MALPPSQVMQMLHGYGIPLQEGPEDDDVRQSYNFAPGYHGLVYRASQTDSRQRATHITEQNSSVGATTSEGDVDGIDHDTQEESEETQYRLQAMKWGLIPFWTKRNPDYGSMVKTINCRDDSLYEDRGMWTTMKKRKRCIVVVQGFYEWLKKNNGRERIPHFVKRKDGQLMLLAGLWDSVKYEDSADTLYTYTIITTDVNKQLSFLHDRMPVIFDANDVDTIRAWLDPRQTEWNKMLQGMLKPYGEELEVYPVNKEVGKVGNNSPSFVVPLDSKENKNNIMNFFGNQKKLAQEQDAEGSGATVVREKIERGTDPRPTVDDQSSENNAPKPVPLQSDGPSHSLKREREDDGEQTMKSIGKSTPAKKMRSATSNGNADKSPVKISPAGSQKITAFFGK